MRVVWTKTAQRRLQEILIYIQVEFGDNAKLQFRSRATDFTRLLAEFPEMGTLEIKEKNLRGFQLTRRHDHCTLRSSGQAKRIVYTAVR